MGGFPQSAGTWLRGYIPNTVPELLHTKQGKTHVFMDLALCMQGTVMLKQKKRIFHTLLPQSWKHQKYVALRFPSTGNSLSHKKQPETKDKGVHILLMAISCIYTNTLSTQAA